MVYGSRKKLEILMYVNIFFRFLQELTMRTISKIILILILLQELWAFHHWLNSNICNSKCINKWKGIISKAIEPYCFPGLLMICSGEKVHLFMQRRLII